MKKILTGIVAMSLILVSASAQTTRKPKHLSSGSETSWQMKSINLTDVQKEQLKNNREQVKEQLADLEKNDKITVKEYRARKAEIMKSQKAAFDKVLTAEQKTALAKQSKDNKGKHFKKGSQHRGRGKDMKTALNLTAEQEAAFKSQREAGKLKAKAIKENDQLTETQKKEELMNLRKSQQADMKAMLTAEQLNKMEANKKSRKTKTDK